MVKIFSHRSFDRLHSSREGRLLYQLARNCSGRGVIVEIGSWKGMSTIQLAKGSRDGQGKSVYTIDPHTGSAEHRERFRNVQTFTDFQKNIAGAGVSDIVFPLVKTSEEAAREFTEPVECIFIDGAHDYESVKLDFELWFPKVINGGLMMFHDVLGFPGVKRAVQKYVLRSPHFRNARIVDSTLFAQKVARNSILDKLQNIWLLCLLETLDFVLKPAIFLLREWRKRKTPVRNQNGDSSFS